ncbi:hypothetical protein Hamer_G010063 [Homarus americanus]|uniref:Uncharacterized protein n=1 Tax=Homarus americanus TaxID=6706 RepID=A0A8J5JFK2_HOMAM|nr:hypothetical protein Hamer_G010063 [Homarus americanus]
MLRPIISGMDKSVVNKGGHPFALDDAGNIPIIDEEDFSHTSHISNTSLALPSSVNTGIMDIDREPEQEQSVRRHVRQNEVCETIDASRCFIDDESCTKDEAKPSVQETEEPGRTLNSADCKCWSQSEKNNPEQRRDVADIDNKNVNLIADESSTQSILDNPANYVTHKLSFPVANKNKDKESLYDAESESQLSVSQISSSEAYLASDFPDVKVKNKTKKQKTHKLGKDGRDSDSSVSSKRKGSSSKTRIKSKFTPGSLEYIEQRLCGRLFSGWVGERRWVESLRAYRDVIEVDEWEVDMNQQLKAIINSIPGVYEGTKWINLSPPGESLCYCLWVLLAAPPVPGHYWYTVTGIQLEPLFGLRILVKEIR